MNWLNWIMIAAFVVLVWIRIAPSSTEKWHDAIIDKSAPKRLGYLKVVRIRGSVAEALSAIDAAASATPRTKVLAGRIEEGKITYITRSLFLGAPDYTTIMAERGGGGSQLIIYGRLRFGLSDGGANRRRIKNWLQHVETVQ
ncbi:MAG: DUF1499 domain-containing protein [Paracoccaceae bacterium]